MIQQLEQEDWQQALRQVVNSWDELCSLLSLNVADLQVSKEAMRQFPLRVPREFVGRMRKGDPQDPLLLQILPTEAEMQPVPGYSQDPLGESKVTPVPGLLHKYYGRVLLAVAGSCPINCRYCFRRHFPYEDHITGRVGWKAMLEYIASDSTIKEVILSGGEPLLLKDELLFDLVENIGSISHVEILRIHTRMPIVIPQRVNDSLISMLRNTHLKIVFVLHCNHPNEIDHSVVSMVSRLKSAEFTVLNQSVLLKNINDDADTLICLSEKLFSAGCLPYYIHLLDPIEGAAHFDVLDEKSSELQKKLQENLPGYLVPKFVREISGEKNKIIIS